MHSTGTCILVVVFYMFRVYDHSKTKRINLVIWVFIYLALMAEAFMGYLLPWGQMSYWGAQVIINLFTTIPL